MKLQPHSHRRYLLIAVIGIVVQFTVFKLLYPFPDFFPDSYYYIATAAAHGNYNIWPIGYSKFLEYGSWFTHNDLILISFQYAVIEGACLFFFFTIIQLYNPGKTVTDFIFIFLVFDPLNLYIGNYVSTDALFWGLTLLWFTLLLRMLHKPQWKTVLLQGIILALLFPLRYTSYYYPIVLVFAVLLSKNKSSAKAVGIFLPMLFIFCFWLYMRNATYEAVGVRQFSSFSGWQLANNTLYMLPFIKVDSDVLPNEQCRQLNQVVKTYFDTASPEESHIAPRDGALYIWGYHSPLGIYANAYLKSRGVNTTKYYLIGWGQMAPLFATYTESLIRQHPFAYVRYYLIPNAGLYAYPPVESLQFYAGCTNQIYPSAQQWFNYDSPSIYCFNNTFQDLIFGFFPLLFLAANICFVTGFTWNWLKRRKLANKTIPTYYAGVTLTGFYLLVNCAFSIVASPIVLRYQISAFLMCTTFSALLYDKEWVKPAPKKSLIFKIEII